MSARSSQFANGTERALLAVLDQAIDYWSTATGKPPSHLRISSKQWTVIKNLVKKLEKGPVFDAENVVPVVAPIDPPCVLYRGVELVSHQPPRRRYRRDDTRGMDI